MITFADIDAETPTRDGLAARYAAIATQLDAGDRDAALAVWDRLRREIETWSSLVHLRFAQDTTDPSAKAAREYADAFAPEATAHEIALKRRLLADADRQGIVALVGAHTVALWEADILTFDPVIAADLEEEARLCARYTALLAGAKLEIDGTVVNLSGVTPFAEDPDRAVRYRAQHAVWGFFAANGDELDDLFDRLVALRHGMARKLGYDNYLGLGYRRMRRLDYGPADVARYRDEVAREVVPLVARLIGQRRAVHGWDRLRYWDEALIDPAGNPRPVGDHDMLVAAAQEMFDAIDPRLGGFYRAMRDGGFLDLRNRPGKAGGGFCTSFPTVGMPFIFANFNGTHGDIGVFTHEIGHAFQNWASRGLPGIDVLWPTMESAEITSMALEFLTHPEIHRLIEPGAAARFRRMHLISSLGFLPYGVCVDHFQHEIYARPNASPAERHAIWQALERRYMPWADYGDLAYPGKGGRWQAKQHIYTSPLYYIDYTLALCCALQFWVRSGRDRVGTLDAYIRLCGLGGSAPFTSLTHAVGLISPFEPGALADVVRAAEAALSG